MLGLWYVSSQSLVREVPAPLNEAHSKHHYSASHLLACTELSLRMAPKSITLTSGHIEAMLSQIRMKTTSGSALAIGFYPTFKYNASGGGGLGQVTAISGSRASIKFDPEEVLIPPLSWRTGAYQVLACSRARSTAQEASQEA